MRLPTATAVQAEARRCRLMTQSGHCGRWTRYAHESDLAWGEDAGLSLDVRPVPTGPKRAPPYTSLSVVLTQVWLRQSSPQQTCQTRQLTLLGIGQQGVNLVQLCPRQMQQLCLLHGLFPMGFFTFASIAHCARG